jgi:hypothetical protein
MINSFSEYAKYYDQIYSDKNYKAEAQYISKILKKKKFRNIGDWLWFGRACSTAS